MNKFINILPIELKMYIWNYISYLKYPIFIPYSFIMDKLKGEYNIYLREYLDDDGNAQYYNFSCLKIDNKIFNYYEYDGILFKGIKYEKIINRRHNYPNYERNINSFFCSLIQLFLKKLDNDLPKASHSIYLAY